MTLPLYQALDVQHFLDGNRDPATTDDASGGFSQGSIWVYPSTGNSWICADATVSAAVWSPLGRIPVNVSGAADGATFEVDINFDGGIATGIDHFAAADFNNGGVVHNACYWLGRLGFEISGIERADSADGEGFHHFGHFITNLDGVANFAPDERLADFR